MMTRRDAVAAVARVPFYLVVRAENPAQDFKAFIACA
jgi:tripartite-type tricarboxylate transporter receptor subunit TctC